MKCALALAALLLLSSCRRPTPGDPPNIAFGRTACSRCGMIVSESRFASGYVDASGRSVVFDDVGELLAAAAEDPSFSKAAFVPDAEDGAWMRAETAFYVRAPGLATPMGSGTAAFKDRPRAEAFAKRRGGARVLDWQAAAASMGAR